MGSKLGAQTYDFGQAPSCLSQNCYGRKYKQMYKPYSKSINNLVLRFSGANFKGPQSMFYTFTCIFIYFRLGFVLLPRLFRLFGVRGPNKYKKTRYKYKIWSKKYQNTCRSIKHRLGLDLMLLDWGLRPFKLVPTSI